MEGSSGLRAEQIQPCTIIPIGPPACGKGTTSESLCRTFPFLHYLGTGLICEALTHDPEVGPAVRERKSSGLFVTDDVLLPYVYPEIDQYDHLVLDGFPRHLGQAEDFLAIAVERGLRLCVLKFDVSEETVRQRM